MGDRYDGGEILPGERVGPFQLGTSWGELEEQLSQPLVREQRSGCFVAKLPSMWFFVDDATQRLKQITVLNRFRGRVANVIGIGSTGAHVEATLGPLVEDEDDNLIIPGIPGVCFEVAFVTGHDVAWQLQHAPIAYISIYSIR
jgi:hypothetical protein